MTTSKQIETAETIIADIARESAMAHMDNIDAAIVRADGLLREDPEYPTIVSILADRGLRRTVGNARHTWNEKIAGEANERRKQAGEFGKPAKVDPLEGDAAMAAVRAHNMLIGGSRLWNMLGSDLRVVAVAEQNTADGHAFNARFCRRLSKRVGPDKLVSECYTMDGLQKAYEDERGKTSNR